jgi:hypothetical protein
MGMNQLNVLPVREFNGWVAGAAQPVQEAVDKFFRGATESLFDQLVWRAGSDGANDKEYRRFERSYYRATGRQWTGAMDFDLASSTVKRDYAEMFTRGHIYGPTRQELHRLRNVPRPTSGLPDVATNIVNEFAAVAAAVERGFDARLMSVFVTDNAGHGGTSPWKRTNPGLPLFDVSNTIFTSGKPNVNIQLPVVSSLDFPTIRDAQRLLDDASEHFLDVDAFDKSFVDPEQLRKDGALFVLTTHKGWQKAFADLHRNDTMATDVAAPLSEGAVLTNLWQESFRTVHTTSQIGQPWEGWVRIFALSNDPAERPLVYADDIPLQSFAFQKDLTIVYGMVLAYFLNVWSSSGSLLMKPKL